MADVHAVSGKMFVGAITSATGVSGTEMVEVEGRRIDFVVPRDMAYFTTGFAPDQIKGYFLGIGPSLPVYIFRARDLGNDSLNEMWREIVTSGGVRSDGTGVTERMADATTTALIVRPNTPTEKTLFIPNASIAPEQVTRFLYDVHADVFSEQEIALVPTRASDSTEPAFAWDTAANINSLFAGLS